MVCSIWIWNPPCMSRNGSGWSNRIFIPGNLPAPTRASQALGHVPGNGLGGANVTYVISPCPARCPGPPVRLDHLVKNGKNAACVFRSYRFPGWLVWRACWRLQAAAAPRAGAPVTRLGDEIMVAGQLFHTGTRVVLWTDPGGYDAYRVERRFAPFDKSDWETSHADVRELQSPNRYGLRRPMVTKPDGTRESVLTPEQIEQVRGGGWDLPLLQSVVDQFVLHFDVAGVSRQCFNTLQDHRDLS